MRVRGPPAREGQLPPEEGGDKTRVLSGLQREQPGDAGVDFWPPKLCEKTSLCLKSASLWQFITAATGGLATAESGDTLQDHFLSPGVQDLPAQLRWHVRSPMSPASLPTSGRHLPWTACLRHSGWLPGGGGLWPSYRSVASSPGLYPSSAMISA